MQLHLIGITDGDGHNEYNFGEFVKLGAVCILVFKSGKK